VAGGRRWLSGPPLQVAAILHMFQVERAIQVYVAAVDRVASALAESSASHPVQPTRLALPSWIINVMLIHTKRSAEVRLSAQFLLAGAVRRKLSLLP